MIVVVIVRRLADENLPEPNALASGILPDTVAPPRPAPSAVGSHYLSVGKFSSAARLKGTAW